MAHELGFSPLTLDSINFEPRIDSPVDDVRRFNESPTRTEQPTEGQIPDPSQPEEKASSFRDFILRAGGGRPSLLNALSAAFGQGTEEIRARKVLLRQQEIEDIIFERQRADLIAKRRQGAIIEDVAGVKRFSGSGERAFPGAEAIAQPLSTPGKVQQDIESGFITREQVNASGGGSAFVEKVNALVSTGIPRDVAIGLQAGRFSTTRDPQTNVAQVIDKATGNLIFDGTQTPPQPSPAAQITPGRGPDVSQALGAGGVARSAVNKIADLFGGELPFQETSEAAAQLSNLNNEAIQLLRTGLDGKLNVQLQQRIERLLVEPNQIFGGEQEAKSKFSAIIDTIDTEAQRLEGQIQRGGLRPKTLDAARQRISELRTLSGKFNSILTSQEPQDKGDINRFFR